ncbi:DUF4166 domain-containing protein [Cupriavidus sp. D39]|uniref:DUF4166 domain-containing protein n=1 Tax=Cupriavidus sp. D39 TaxID=2997877 RepID=UPI00226D7F7F|nr:DUF4166 domain-containing protein [Cupriavidus sp. D39]MCY0856838.1 DUF4166 domain-containing protein [Cupriavidus sp. D39]
MTARTGIYEIMLGASFADLPPVLQRVHRAQGIQLTGTLRVRWSQRRWLRVLLHLSALPRPAQAAPTRVAITPLAAGEQWHRQIGGTLVASRMEGARAGQVTERMGSLALALDTRVDGAGRLRQASRRVSLFGMPLPWLRVLANERALDGHRYCCDVRIWMPRLGYLLRYDGVLAICEPDL